VIERKFLSISQAAEMSQAMRARQERLVFTNGCFGLLHVGHVRYLEQARSLGDALIVAINGDDSVRHLKGPDRPLNSEADRALVVAALEAVTYVVIFPEMRASSIIRTITPQIYVKGGDYSLETLDPEERHAIDKVGATVTLLPLIAGYSTTTLVRKVHDSE
jgi:rfaE bifunctional protein nucleotidyltransferase chain/domain